MTLRRNEEQGAEKDDKRISMPKPALFAVGYMESDWIRYAIQDERGRYWTGRGFSKDERKAFAYADENVIARGQVVAEQERFDEFEDLAKQMGSKAWKRIIRLVDRAMKRQKKPLAIKVFEAAMTKGDHLEFLKEKYEKLKRGHWSPDPRKQGRSTRRLDPKS
jgi:hypothetical protein